MADESDLERRIHELENKGILPWEAPMPTFPEGMGPDNFIAFLKEKNEQHIAEIAAERATAEERGRKEQLRLQLEADAELERQHEAWRKNRRRRSRELGRLQDIEVDLEKLRQQERQLVADRAACLKVINIGTRPPAEEDDA